MQKTSPRSRRELLEILEMITRSESLERNDEVVFDAAIKAPMRVKEHA